MDFSPMQLHPIHLRGHTFWKTGHEAARIPKSTWIPHTDPGYAIPGYPQMMQGQETTPEEMESHF